MSESRGVVRMNISVPAELKKQMDAESGSANWSAVAAKAFHTKLLELQAHKGATKMDDVIARLKAAAKLEANQDRAQGEEAGQEWAKAVAKPKQLRRLFEKNDVDLFAGEPDAYGWAGVLYVAINGDHEFDRNDVDNFWETVLGEGGIEQIEDVDFAEGFVAGALGVWHAVKFKI